MRRTESLFIFFAAISAISLLFVILPLANIILSQSPESLVSAGLDIQVRDAIMLSILSAAITALIGAIFAIPVAYLLARKSFFGKSIVEAAIDLPLVVPHTVAGVAILLVFGKFGIIGAPAHSIFGISFFGTIFGVIIAMLFVSFPFLVNSIREGFESVNPRLEMAAMTLGASHLEVFKRISLPLAKRGIAVGMLMGWARGISEFGAVVVIAYFPKTAPVMIYEKFLSSGLADSSSAAAILLLVCLAAFAILRVLSVKK